ncbi:MAG: peptidoglycan D,D-transpeptidase FtsI family protein, partial [Desulfovibrionales bacterium]
MAQRQYWTKKEVRGTRGEIFDRNGVLLAKSVEINSVYARPQEVMDPRNTAQKLSKILGISENRLYRRLREKKSFVWIARKIGDLPSKKLKQASLPGIHQLLESERVYPQGHLAGQLLGFVGVDNKGLEGLELTYDEYLRGGISSSRVQRDARGGILETSFSLAMGGGHGRDLELTLDARIQYAVEEALEASIKRTKAKSGMGLVVEVASGDILSWAVYPFFNPNSYKDQQPGNWRNTIALDVFEPGSTTKPFLIAAALEAGVCDRDTIFFCENGSWDQKGYCIDDTHEYGWLPVNRILSYSSNIGAAKIGLALGGERYYEFLQAFGFGKRTLHDLPGESSGLLRDSRSWYPVDLATASFGQGIATTMLQLAQGYLCLAREGTFTPLRLVKKPAKVLPPGKQVVSARVAHQVLSMM